MLLAARDISELKSDYSPQYGKFPSLLDILQDVLTFLQPTIDCTIKGIVWNEKAFKVRDIISLVLQPTKPSYIKLVCFIVIKSVFETDLDVCCVSYMITLN